MRAQIGPDEAGVPSDRSSSLGWEAEPEGFGGSKVEGENEVWPGLRRNPGVPNTRTLSDGAKAEGPGPISRFRRPSSLAGTRYPPHRAKSARRGPRYASLLAP